MSVVEVSIETNAEWVRAAVDRRRVVVSRPNRPDVLGTLVYAGPNGGRCRVLVPGCELSLTFGRHLLRLVPLH